MEAVEKVWLQISELGVQYGMKLIGAIVVLIIGMMVAKKIGKVIGKIMDKRNMDPSLKPFLLGLLVGLIKVMVVLSALGIMGIEMTSFIAILAAAGLAVGMALSGTLQNFAGGVMILIFKPFKVGDVIDAQGYLGSVSSIQIFNTVLKTGDNKTVIIPNGGLSTSALTNFSTEDTRRVDWTIGIGYGDDTAKAESVILDLLAADNRILTEKAPFVAVSELADSSVNFTVRAWVNAGDYWGVFFDMNNKVYNKFNEVGLNIPYPQMDVHVHKS